MSGQPVTGYLCPPCSDATDNAAAVGTGAIHRSLRDHLPATGDESTLERLGRTELPPPTITWASLVLRARRTGRPVPGPNTTRWGHLTLV